MPFRVYCTILSLYEYLLSFVYDYRILQIKLLSNVYQDITEYITEHGKPGHLASYSYEEKGCIIGLGVYWISYKSHWIKCTKQIVTDLKGPEKYELILSTYSKNSSILTMFVDDCCKELSTRVRTRISIYEFDARLCHWCKSRTRILRDLSSVVVSDDAKDLFINDLKEFCSAETKRWYTKHFVPYRRSYLLEGPPGTGKSSLIVAISSELNLNIGFVQLSVKGMCDQSLAQAMNEQPHDSILIIEDVDAIFDTISGKKEQVCVTFSGLLNALDGIGDSTGRIIIMTTNNMEKLDASLIRPGRVDQVVHIGCANNKQIENMFLRFYESADKEDTVTFRKNVRNHIHGDITTAELQKFFIENRKENKEICIEAKGIERCVQGKKDQTSYN